MRPDPTSGPAASAALGPTTCRPVPRAHTTPTPSGGTPVHSLPTPVVPRRRATTRYTSPQPANTRPHRAVQTPAQCWINNPSRAPSPTPAQHYPPEDNTQHKTHAPRTGTARSHEGPYDSTHPVRATTPDTHPPLQPATCRPLAASSQSPARHPRHGESGKKKKPTWHARAHSTPRPRTHAQRTSVRA